MTRVQVGIVRYASVARAIAEALGVEPPPECRIGQARIALTFRQIGASRWPESRQLELALRAATTARRVLAGDSRSSVRQRARRAIEVVFVDVGARHGCAVESRWECVVPHSESTRE